MQPNRRYHIEFSTENFRHVIAMIVPLEAPKNEKNVENLGGNEQVL